MESEAPRRSICPSWFSEESPGRLIAVAAVLIAGAIHPGTRWGVVVLVVLLAIIGVHEAGHLAAARATGIGADQYWIGFGPKIWSRRTPNLHWGIRAVPLGGYVRIIGMGSAPTEHGSGGSYADASWVRKICVAGAGPAVNIVLGTVAMFIGLVAIGPPGVTTTLGSVAEGSPAETVGLEVGDRITGIDGVVVDNWERIPALVGGSDGSVAVAYERNGESGVVMVDPVDIDGKRSVGIGLATGNVSRAPSEALGDTASFMVDSAGLLIGSLDTLPAQALPTAAPEDQRAVSPVGIAQIASQSSLWTLIILFVAVNLFLAIFNLLPVPPFDGGHIVVAAGERLVSAVVGRVVTVPKGAILTVSYVVFALLTAVGLSSIFRDLTDPIRM